ncbi:hypothetical protein HDU76_008010, partial [Blyttiomyces sp. JEL0837]
MGGQHNVHVLVMKVLTIVFSGSLIPILHQYGVNAQTTTTNTSTPTTTTPTTNTAVHQWPSAKWDEMEDIVYLNTGYRSRGFTNQIVPCNGNNAVYLRMSFHDMAGHNAANGTGGLDASLRFELTAPENGETFGAVMEFFTYYLSDRASLSDLFAAGQSAAVAACGGPVVPLRVGRVDAQKGGVIKVPHVTDTYEELIGNFTVFGFSQSEMISLIACAHTLGGVESDEHPEIVGNNTKIFFDTTTTNYDNAVVVEYLNGHPQNPLVSGPLTSDSDLRIFSSDGNVTISQMKSPEGYSNRCQTILAKLLDSVPKESQLSEVLVPYDVKPVGVKISTDADENVKFSGEIRVRTTNRPVESVKTVSLLYKDGNGKFADCDGCQIVATPVDQGVAKGGFPQESFAFYEFNRAFTQGSGVSSYVVQITDVNGGVETFDNNKVEFPVQDVIFFSKERSCLSFDGLYNLTFTIVAGVRKDHAKNPVSINLTYGSRNPNDTVPSADLNHVTVPMTQLNSTTDNAAYVYFTGTYTVPSWGRYQTAFDVVVPAVSGKGNEGSTFADTFHKITELNDQACAADPVVLNWGVGLVDVNPDNKFARKAIGINGQWPPEPIVANVGDSLEIVVTNNLNEPTALHFHGLFQNGTVQYDGVPGITQCPIPPGSSFTYKVSLAQEGTFWINSYQNGQTFDGLRIPLIVNNPAQPNLYDVDYFIPITDWYHSSYNDLFPKFQTAVGKQPVPDALLLNEGQNMTIKLTKDKTSRFRFVSMALSNTNMVWFDEHNMTIIEVDGVSVKPFKVTALKIAPGQRYSVLVTGTND